MHILVEHLNWHVKGWRHRRIARRVLATPPIVPLDDGVILFSMIGTAVLHPYLVAVKSLHHHLGRGRVVVLDDGTLTEADHALLRHHCGGPRIIPIDSVDTGSCPRRNVWERLLAILDLRDRDYVVQVDSDTVTLGPVPEVAAAIDAGRSFTLRGEASAGLLDAGDFVRSRPAIDPHAPGTHVQDAAEAVIDRVEGAQGGEPLRYVRGCAGFAGFARSDGGRAFAERFSAGMDRLIGRASWGRWGSEQVAANAVVANDPAPVLLSYDRYLNYWNAPVGADARFVHFIGTYRFHGSAYLDATRDAIAALDR